MRSAERCNKRNCWALALPLLFQACATATGAGDLLHQAEDPGASVDTLALAAIEALDRGATDAGVLNPAALIARARVQAGAGRSTRLALAQLLVAEDALDLEGQRAAAVALLQRDPAGPGSALASQTLQRLAGVSTTLDRTLRQDLSHVLAQTGTDLEVQHRLRDALVSIVVAQGDYEEAQRLRASGGLLQSWEIVGPLSPYRYLDFDRPLGPERAPQRASFTTPWGTEEAWRPLRMNNGQLPIGHTAELSEGAEDGRGHAPTGDLVYLRTSVTAAGGGLWVRIESSASATLFLDGRRVLSRDLFRRLAPRSQWLELAASDGPHVLLLKAVAGEAGHSLRLDALPRSAAGHLPPTLSAQRRAFGELLEQTGGGPLPGVLAALAAADLDPHGALAQLQETAVRDTLGLGVSADLWPLLGTLADEDARGRTQRDLDSWLSRDPHSLAARLRRAQLLTELGRYPAAEQDLDTALSSPTGGAASHPLPLLIARARLLLSRDASPLAGNPIAEALASDPGSCGALELALSLADQANSFGRSEELARQLGSCPGGQQTLAQRRARSEGPGPLIAYWSGRLQRSPSDPEAASQLADQLFAKGDLAGAQAALDVRLRSWPGDGVALRRKATLEDLAAVGSTGAPRPSARWADILSQDPLDLGLRRVLALLAGQPEPLEALVPAAGEVLRGPRWLGAGRAPSATLLDSGAAYLHRDGTVTERVRTLEVPLDENALQPLGELELPPGAVLLGLRTHKPDGRVLDADAQTSGEKRTVSAADLQVGDTLEIDFVMANPPSRRGLGGAAEPFYFAASDSSLLRSVYTTQGDLPLEIDAHRIPSPAPGEVGQPVQLERRKVEAISDEPSTPPQNEFFPWVQIGTAGLGAHLASKPGLAPGDAAAAELARSVADQLADKTLADEGLHALLAGLPSGGDRTRSEALWIKLNAALRAEGGTLSEPASEVIGQGTGNLILPMRAGLTALGIDNQLVLASGPGQSQERHRFARLTEYGDVLLRIAPHGEPAFFLAAALRDAPFGRLPPNLCGARALLLPNVLEREPAQPKGEAEVEPITLPACPEQAAQPGPDEHVLSLELAVDGEGSVVGSARETLHGFEAVNLRSSLEQLDDPQRRQGVESALASVFQGVELTDVAFELGKVPGAALEVSYKFKVAHLARREAKELFSLPLAGFPAHLGDRYAQLASRQLPLAIPAGERPVLELAIRLPAGALVEGSPPAAVALQGRFGSYLRRETRSGPQTTVHEKLVLPPQRIAPDAYPQFSDFAAKVDEAQAERLFYRLPSGQAVR